MKNKITNIVLFVLGSGIIVCFIYIANAQLSNREASLVSIILALLSITASYLISQHFSKQSYLKALEQVKEQHIENLRTYALNAAEKVDNLSIQLSRMSMFLEDELEKEIDSDELILQSRTERIESAIHILNTLKSVNDTSLSDWRGVIPEELEEKSEEKLEREAELNELISRVEEITDYNPYRQNANISGELKEEIDDLRKQVIKFTRRIEGIRIRPKKLGKPLRESVEKECLQCGQKIAYKQRPMTNSFKPTVCSSCGEKFTARWFSDKGFILIENVPKEEKIKCPSCGNIFNEQVDTAVFSICKTECPECRSQLKLTRNVNKVSIKRLSGPMKDAPREITDNLLNEVKKELPEQPWPRDIHKEVATKLGVSNRIASRCMDLLIKNGDFYPQINGVVYYPKEK